MPDSRIMSYVGGVDKVIPEAGLEEFYTKEMLQIGYQLFDWQYIPDPDPTVFKDGEARISYLAKPVREGQNV